MCVDLSAWNTGSTLRQTFQRCIVWLVIYLCIMNLLRPLSKWRSKGSVQVEVNILASHSLHFDRLRTDEAKTVRSLAPLWQRPPLSTRHCQVTISQVPPSITLDIANDYTLCVNANVRQEVSWYKAWISCSMTNDVPNEGWTQWAS